MQTSNLLDEVKPKHDVRDEFVWSISPEKYFTVKSCYEKFLQEKSSTGTDVMMQHVLKMIWKTKIPSKVKLFCWRLFLDRLPIRTQLFKR